MKTEPDTYMKAEVVIPHGEPNRQAYSSWASYLRQRALWISEANKQLRLRPFLKNYAQNGVVNYIHARPPEPNQ